MPREPEKHKVIDVMDLDDDVFIMRLERRGLEFEAGQYLHVSPGHGEPFREYSVCSAPGGDAVEILVREVPDGLVSPALHRMRAGDEVRVEGPFGAFRIDPGDEVRRFLFIAAGTGIAPFAGFIRANPHLDFRLVHGVRRAGETWGEAFCPPERMMRCVSRENGGYQGRVTGWLEENPPPADELVYLCGSGGMIDDACAILGMQGFPADGIRAEVFFDGE